MKSPMLKQEHCKWEPPWAEQQWCFLQGWILTRRNQFVVRFLSLLSPPTHRTEENSGYSTFPSFFLSHSEACDGREFDPMMTRCLKPGNWNDCVHTGWRLKSQDCLLEEILSLEKLGCIFHSIGTTVVLLSINSVIMYNGQLQIQLITKGHLNLNDLFIVPWKRWATAVI